MTIKAIETVYKGYRFRSRLEARWAVFFDALGIAWDYEPEGFELPSGGRYLPDFLLRDNGIHPDLWVEVKPPKPIPPANLQRVREFANMQCAAHRHIGVLVVRGDPYQPDMLTSMSCDGDRVEAIINSIELFVRFWSPLIRRQPSDIAAAAEDARSARFEYGESGAWRK